MKNRHTGASAQQNRQCLLRAGNQNKKVKVGTLAIKSVEVEIQVQKFSVLKSTALSTQKAVTFLLKTPKESRRRI